VLNGCHYEFFWLPITDQALQILNASNVQPLSLPQLPRTATTYLDTHTRNSLEQRIGNLSNTLGAYQDALAWCAYYRASFWGELRFDDDASETQTAPADFDDGSVGSLPNVLDAMFDGNIRYHTSWWGDFFEITDRTGNTFQWNRLFSMDDWKPCANPRNQQLMDGHVKERGADDVESITGRFLFTHKGGKTPYCYPFAHPDGTAMSEHLVQYYGETLFPVTAAYNGGWLALLSEIYPQMFTSELFLDGKNEAGSVINENDLLSLIRNILVDAGFEIGDASSLGGEVQDYLGGYILHCGCRP
jgi:hypothetical protein